MLTSALGVEAGQPARQACGHRQLARYAPASGLFGDGFPRHFPDERPRIPGLPDRERTDDHGDVIDIHGAQPGLCQRTGRRRAPRGRVRPIAAVQNRHSEAVRTFDNDPLAVLHVMAEARADIANELGESGLIRSEDGTQREI